MKKILIYIMVVVMALALCVFALADDDSNTMYITLETESVEVCNTGMMITSTVTYQDAPRGAKLEVEFNPEEIYLSYVTVDDNNSVIFAKPRTEGSTIVVITLFNKKGVEIGKTTKTYASSSSILVEEPDTIDFNTIKYDIFMSAGESGKRRIKYRCGSPTLACSWGNRKDENNIELYIARKSKLPSCGVKVTLTVLDEYDEIVAKRDIVVFEDNFVNDKTVKTFKDELSKQSQDRIEILYWNESKISQDKMYISGMLQNTTSDTDFECVTIKYALLDKNDSTINTESYVIENLKAKACCWVRIALDNSSKKGTTFRLAEVTVK